MNCCHIQTERKPQRSLWRGVSGSAGSGALLVLLPKCPICIAAYLTLWTGASVAMPVATHLRPLLEIVFVASALLLLARCLTLRTRDRMPHVPILGRGKVFDGDRSKRTG